MTTPSSHAIALLAPGAMGAAIAARLLAFGAGTILTHLDGRSEATIQRARESNMQHASYAEIAKRATCIYSVVPPVDAFGVAEAVVGAYRAAGNQRELVFVDCNAVNPESVKRMATLFDGTGITFLDGVIIGPPPTDSFNPGIYVSADPKDVAILDEFVLMSTKFGLNVIPLKGEGAGIGDASALKMAHGGIVKGTIGLFTMMILSANAASPSTAEGLLHALNLSQPVFVDLIIRFIPEMLPKAYRFVGEMEEVGGFVGPESAGARTFEGLAGIFARVASAQELSVGVSTAQADGVGVAKAQENTLGDVELLLKFVEQARETRVKEPVRGV
ncbi:hypothetical protein B0H10DRAFT_2233798 [Mycena sp. CBHHK59/15]|nr:hypothetical protein B0H10DRAFT_2233798 [Mycena sp. CBHHK59/15]